MPDVPDDTSPADPIAALIDRQFAVMREIQRIAPGTEFTPTAMQLPKDLPYDKWCAVGELLASLSLADFGIDGGATDA